MGKIYYLMGKSASGKDSIYRLLREDTVLNLHTVTLYTTRPLRDGEEEGVEYHFTDDAGMHRLEQAGKVIECRAYQTVHGIWKYATVDDGQIHLEEQDYLIIGTLESFIAVRDYFGKECVIPVYVYVEDGERLLRAIARERQQTQPKYAELCRRFLADEADFQEEKLLTEGITEAYRFENHDLQSCFEQIKAWMMKQ